MSPRAFIVLSVAALALAGCGSAESSPASSPSTGFVASTLPISSSPAASGARTTVVPTGQTAAFAAPGGDVVCELSAESARCDAPEHTYAPPAKPASCTKSWGAGFELRAAKAAPVCSDDTVYDGATAKPTWFVESLDKAAPRGVLTFYILGAGHTLEADGISCGTDPAGVATCRTSDGSHGFMVSKAAYRTW